MTDWQYPTTRHPTTRHPTTGPATGAGIPAPAPEPPPPHGAQPPTPPFGVPQRSDQVPAGFDPLRPIGTGRLGQVLLCRETGSGREVAVKILDIRLDDDGHRLALHAELLATAVAARHPCAVTVEDLGFTADGHPYLAMEACPGGSLEARLAAAGPLPVDEVLAIAVRLTLALHSAHRRGVLHLDVRPANVLLDAAGDALLADHGVARAVQRAAPSYGALFDPRYAARELFGWEPPSPSSDVYGLGATVYALLAGVPARAEAAEQGSAALYAELLRGEPPPLSRPDVPDRLAGLLRRMIAPNPEDRPPLTEVHRMFRGLLPAGLADRVPPLEPEPDHRTASGEPAEVGAEDHDLGPDTRRELRKTRQRHLVAAGGAAALVLLAGFVALVLSLQNSDDGGGDDPGTGPRGPGQQPSAPVTTAAAPVPESLLREYQARSVEVTGFGRNLMVSWKAPRTTTGVSGYLVVAQPPGSEEIQAKQYAVNGQLNAVFTVPPADASSCFVVTTLVTRESKLEVAPAEPACQGGG